MGTNTRMHLAIIIVAVAAVAASSAGCTNQATQSPTPGAPAGFVLYVDKTAGVQMYYPSDWQLTGGLTGGSIATFEHGNDSILFQIQRSALNQTGQTVENLAQRFISNVQSNGSASLLENHSVSLVGLPGYKTVVAFKVNGQPYKALAIWTIKGNSFYELLFSGTAVQYDEQNATAQQMISTFNFI